MAIALNKHKGLQQLFKWLAEDEEIEQSPLTRVRQPKTPTKLIPIIDDADTKLVLAACKGKTFPTLRDLATIRLYYNTGARLPEVANLTLDDVDLNTDSVYVGPLEPEARQNRSHHARTAYMLRLAERSARVRTQRRSIRPSSADRTGPDN